ncbi:G-patch domain and KOW motifs-containing protein [Paramormyrops kingsleyae]|uniref:G-patch domain and KOW motifs-containing protein n=1 Tax=Paramormyrops kingsleyae TaxID=1676925 RepID=A0A3B3S489_9TELE|nr:G-patch domain and KOW motifs-containing protein [Paramormyrops kingsleyae]
MASKAGEKHGDGIDQGIVDPRCQQDGEDKKPAPISFGFSKTSSKFKTSSNLNESEREERDYLTGVEEKELKSTKPVEQKKELVIPLILKNRWVRQEKPKKEPPGSKDCPPSQELDSVESQAVKELVEESRRQLDQWTNGTQEVLDLTIPLLMQNQVPQGFEDGDRVKVDLRPESSTDADYESVPVEAYGLAMLKGMGWKEDEGIGRTFKQVVKPIEHQLRPKGLGLGADRSALKDLEPSGPRRPPKPGEDRSEEELVLAPGASVLLEAGAHKDHYGKVEGMDPDNARVMVKLAIGGKTVTVSQYNIRLVGRKEYDRNAKDLSRHSKAHMEAEKEKERERKKEKKREERAERNEQQQRSKEKKDKRRHADSREKTPPVKLPRQELSTPTWLQRDLRVRFIDKTFKGGKYYNSKMTVEDVLTPRTCVCRTEEGRLLDGVKQEMLETMVPKSESDCIMVVLGEHRGQVGRILQRDKERCRAMVQLDRHEEKIYTLDYDSICHYVGGGYA